VGALAITNPYIGRVAKAGIDYRAPAHQAVQDLL